MTTIVLYTADDGEIIDWDEEPDEPFTEGPYRGRLMQCTGFPTPVHVRTDDADQWCTVVMYGDDAIHHVERDNLAPLGDDDDFCRGCGSFGCGHGR